MKTLTQVEIFELCCKVGVEPYQFRAIESEVLRINGITGTVPNDVVKDAERYRFLRKQREVMLITSFFGNGCINKTIEDFDAAIDAAMLKEKK